MKSDMNDRKRLERVDNEGIHRAIARVRRMMFVDGMNITNKAVDMFLKSESLVPTRVCNPQYFFYYSNSFVERILIALF